MEVDKRTCKRCQHEIRITRCWTKDTRVYTGECGKTITFFQGGRIKYDDIANCPECPDEW